VVTLGHLVVGRTDSGSHSRSGCIARGSDYGVPVTHQFGDGAVCAQTGSESDYQFLAYGDGEALKGFQRWASSSGFHSGDS